MTRRLVLATVLAGAAGCARGAGVELPPAPAQAAPRATITAEELRRDLSAFAADSFHGRETGTPDANRAAAFIAERLTTLGLEPAGDSLYLQRVPLVRDRFTEATRFEVVEGGRTTPLALATDLLPLMNLGPGAPEPRHHAAGEVVFAGYGVQSAELGRDDFAGMNLQGKVVVVLHGAPANASAALKTRLEEQTELGARLGRILPQAPEAVVFLMTPGTAGFYDQVATDLQRQVSAAGRRRTTSDAERPLPMILLGVARAGSPLLPAGWPNDDRAQPLPGRRFSAGLEIASEPFTGYNVVAVARGTDPSLEASYVAFGAHYDHIGMQQPVEGDAVANGADDDGSGSVALLAIARQMKLQPPRRSALFVWHVGEEKGLLGSAYFTEHPTVPIESIVAQLNADMIGRNDPEELYLVGPNAAPNQQSRVLGQIVDSVNAALPRPFRVNREWDSPDHPEQIYQRSDHFNYARRGIPIVFFTTGLHPEYHRVSDEVEKIDFDKLARVADLMLAAGRAVGNRSTAPR